ncbi:MAG: hypothetical protein CBC09_07705 [Cellvibrionales bacterium TMED49]|nr:bifunctional folylpolyglutamate synthase/dihydrofolate synthase [Porticoccaceae bacterium]OUU37022.1 MAG: hypothetical protein CBC09_07705 [Cellvibrionales bacterium TMED49]
MDRKSALERWLIKLQCNQAREIDLSLQRVSTVWNRINNSLARNSARESDSMLTFTVAGTNGKGSCVMAMESVLQAHGYVVGTYTSPHLFNYNERIRVSGVPVNDAIIIEAFEFIESECKSIVLTYFEYSTLAALWIFNTLAVQVRVLEVGLGGRLDAVNIVSPDVAVVTSIALDHQYWLGTTKAEIALEKLGITRINKPLIWGERSSSELDELLIPTGAVLYRLGIEFDISMLRQDFTVKCLVGNNNFFVSGIPGDSELVENKAIALQSLLAGGYSLDSKTCRLALSKLELTGRFQRASIGDISIILDVAHNPAAATLLAKRLCLLGGNFFAVASVLADKDWIGITAPLSEIVTSWHVAEISDSNRAMDARKLLSDLKVRGLKSDYFGSLESAFLAAYEKSVPGDTIVAFGSFHVVASILKVISSWQER